MTMLRSLLLFILYWLIFQAAFQSGLYYQSQSHTLNSIHQIEKRIALDIPLLSLADERFNTVTDQGKVAGYLGKLNQWLAEQNASIRVHSLAGVAAPGQQGEVLYTSELLSPDLSVRVSYSKDMALAAVPLTAWAPLMALGMLFLSRKQLSRKKTTPSSELPVTASPRPKLVINLFDKTMQWTDRGELVAMQNKPLCFYLALLDYCVAQESPTLNHSSEVPDSLIQMANKYFYRLIELGHTKRKRPDFNTNLDKTLSEIRAVLDEVFVNADEHKHHYYPPKAIGEGSRSRRHNYALPDLRTDDFDILGK